MINIDNYLGFGKGFFSLIAFIPFIGMVITAVLFYFIFKFYRNESKMNFPEKIRLLKKLVNIVLILFLAGVVCLGLFLLIAISILFGKGGVFGMAAVSIGTIGGIGALLPILVQFYFYYLIYKEYQVLVNNFEQEIIFEDENVASFKKIAKVLIWIVFLQLAVSFLNYAAVFGSTISLQSGMSLLFGDINLNISIDTSILMYFIVCVMMNILSVVFARAVEIYKENQLTI